MCLNSQTAFAMRVLWWWCSTLFGDKALTPLTLKLVHLSPFSIKISTQNPAHLATFARCLGGAKGIQCATVERWRSASVLEANLLFRQHLCMMLPPCMAGLGKLLASRQHLSALSLDFGAADPLIPFRSRPDPLAFSSHPSVDTVFTQIRVTASLIWGHHAATQKPLKGQHKGLKPDCTAHDERLWSYSTSPSATQSPRLWSSPSWS